MTREQLPLRLVLDTNVWLDWLVFDDASVMPLKAAVDRGDAEIFIDDACAGELTKVLAYPLRKQILGVDVQAACVAECGRIARAVTSETAAEFLASEPLPKCRDADDQKFLELARACGADFLVTRDLLLLELSRRKIRRAPFAIVTPEQLVPALTTR
jgi:putative PIN family toxin of toxin-antitoxin system